MAKRLEFTNTQAVLGVSGGLDSTLALLVTVRAYEILGRGRQKIIAVTMPCFGTTERTNNNAHKLCNALGFPCREINIAETVRQHLSDISHPENQQDITYENAQARVRTLVLMNLANKENGIVIGSGSLSELALGWTTYNGDHMSMYGVNSGVPKTLVRRITEHIASKPAILFPRKPSDETLNECRNILNDILKTPVSPELLPPKDGEIVQRTENILGSYELTDFFIYHALHHGRRSSQILELASIAFENYPEDEIKNRLKQFLQRFFSQQYKRSCLPDGPKIGSISLSPQGWHMPSDASGAAWDM